MKKLSKLFLISVAIWLGMTLSFLVYLLVQYIFDPLGTWVILPNISCNPEQRWPMYLHIVSAALSLLTGPILVTNFIYPTRLHRWVGVIYVMGAFLTSVFGTIFIILNGTLGGLVMNIAFTINAIVVVVYCAITVFYAIRARITFAASPYRQLHYNWAAMTFFVASSSPFYRVLYLLKFLVMCKIAGVCVRIDFHAPIDYVFDFAFFLVPMAIGAINIWVGIVKEEPTFIDLGGGPGYYPIDINPGAITVSDGDSYQTNKAAIA